jgi:hypothetical protein
MDANDLGYDPTSLLGPLDMTLLASSQQHFQDRGMPIVFDPAYIRHLARFHGGIPKKRCFRAGDGKQYIIERFLHFADEKKGSNDKLGWYHVNVTWSLIVERLNDFLVPFAVLFAGDMLCFDYEYGDRPHVVVWLHEKSKEYSPFTVPVAHDFDRFLSILAECSD